MWNFKSQKEIQDGWWAEKSFFGLTRRAVSNIVLTAVAIAFFLLAVNYMGIDRILGITGNIRP